MIWTAFGRILFCLTIRKYERTKQLASDLKEREESTLKDRKTLRDNLKMQEARYEKMKTHAMAQLEMYVSIAITNWNSCSACEFF